MKQYISILFILITSISFSSAQQAISLQQAIDDALAKNYSIRIAKEKMLQAEIANSYSMAGALPQAYISGNTAYVDFIDGNSGAIPQIQNTVYASMPLFNGFKIIATKQQLEALQLQGEIALTIQIQNTIASIMQTYYEILRQQQYTNILQTSHEVAQERLSIITIRKSVGLANDADFLQAQIDVSAIEQQILQQQTIVAQTKSELLLGMGNQKIADITLSDSITFGQLPNYSDIVKKLEQNPQLLYAQLSTTIAQSAVKQIQAQRYPSVKLFTSYNVTTYESSTVAMPLLGVSYVIPLYSGGMYKTQQAIAQSKITVSQIEHEQTRYSLYTHMYQTYMQYEQTMQQLQKQIDTYEYSKQLLNLVMKRFEANMATMLEVKAAQLSFEQAGYTLANQKFAVKIAEIEILRVLCEIGIN